jgi:hypothetical protein
MSENEVTMPKSFTPEEQELFKRQMINVVHMAEIGSHFVKFITTCHMMKMDPATVMLFMAEKNEESRQKDPTTPYIPVICFLQWLSDNTDENVKKMSKAFDIDFDKEVEKLINTKTKGTKHE